MFNSFYCALLNISENTFSIMYTSYRKKNNDLITNVIRISCKHKRNLCVLSKNTDDFQVKNYYKRYCSISRKVIREAKKLHYNTQIKNSVNKVKTICNIIKKNTGRTHISENIFDLSSDSRNTKDVNEIAYTFNKFFLSIPESCNY
jgi:hypothetical protein